MNYLNYFGELHLRMEVHSGTHYNIIIDRINDLIQ